MNKTRMWRIIATIFSVLTISVTGQTSQVLALSPTIQNTGAGSTNSITVSSSIDCNVENNNSVSTNNTADQHARTGDIIASQNTAVGDEWGSWNPAVWAAHGKTYAEWSAAFHAYMSSQSASWEANWGSSGQYDDGNITSGNASNSNSVNVGVSISNRNANDTCTLPSSQPNTPLPHSNKTDEYMNGSGSGRFQSKSGGSTDTVNSRLLGNSNLTVSGEYSQTPQGVGGSGSGAGGGNNSPIGDEPVASEQSASIENTGQDSTNDITIHNSNTYTVNNNNSATVVSSTNQSSQSGSVSLSYNTFSGGSSGEAGNSSSGNGSVVIAN